MPERFSCYSDYTNKLIESLSKEAEIERLRVECVSARNVTFEFIERHKI